MKIKSLPRDRYELLKVIEDELEITYACLCSYIDFKRESLQLVYVHNLGNVQEEENLETQSSLDGDDNLMQNTSGTSADHHADTGLMSAGLGSRDAQSRGLLSSTNAASMASGSQGASQFQSNGMSMGLSNDQRSQLILQDSNLDEE